MRALLVAALLVAGAAPCWAQSDSRWLAVFHLDGYRGKGYSRSMGGGDRAVSWMVGVHRIARQVNETAGIPYRVFSLPDSGSWARVIGSPRLNGEADSTWFRRNGCMGWFMTHDFYSSSFNGATYTGESVAYFTGTGATAGTFDCSPLSGNWGIPGVVFNTGNGTQTNAGQGFYNGITAQYSPPSPPWGGRRTDLYWADNGDSLSGYIDRLAVASAGEASSVTAIIHGREYNSADGLDSTILAAWSYGPKRACLWYNVSASPLIHPTAVVLGLADVLRRAGYRPAQKLVVHIDLDHPYPDKTFKEWPSDSLFRYTDALPWRYAGPVESHSSEIADDSPALASKWKARASKWPAHPHSHNFLNFGNGDPASGGWDLSTFGDSATKSNRWGWMHRTIADTLRHPLQTGTEKTATFPNNDVMFPDLYIFARSGYSHIRVRADADSNGVPKSLSLRRWRRVPGPRAAAAATSGQTAGLPYMWIEPKSNRPMYVHDSFEHPVSSDTAWVTATDYVNDVGGYASRNVNNVFRAAVFGGGTYWHPDLNVTGGQFMADFHRRLLYVYGRTNHLIEVLPIYRPAYTRPGGSARAGGTSRSSYTDNR